MDSILMIILVLTAALSLVPVVKMNGITDDTRYRCLRMLVNTAFAWTILIFLERLIPNLTVVYYIHMLGYPIKYLLASFMVCTIFEYTDKTLFKYALWVFIFGLIAELGLSFTNGITGWMLALSPSSITQFEDLYVADNGPVFMLHLFVLYSMLLISIGYLFYFLYNHRDIRYYRSIAITMGLSVVVVLAFNLSQLLLLEVTVDLTYISLIIVSFALYRVIFLKDMVYNLKLSGRGEILSNMREMYILTDSEKNVIEISNLLIEKYNVEHNQYLGEPIERLFEVLRKDIVFYSEYEIDQDVDDNSKDHFHLREKKFTLRGMKEFGYMILLFDETQVYNLLRELHRLSNYDSMTGLHNRNYIEQYMNNTQQLSHFGIISLDLNGLKVNNDYLGHERGDYLLKKLAKLLKQVMHEYSNKHIARIGGDEFLIILEHTTEDQLQLIKQAILEQSYSDELMDRISVSIGVAYSEQTANIMTLVQLADNNMYEMKRQTSREYAQAIVAYARNTDSYIR